MAKSKLEQYAKYAHRAYQAGDDSRWVAAYWAAQIVGNYERGATLSLAKLMGVSVDTVENLAHAYMMYSALRSEIEFRSIARRARRWPTVYQSHFLSLYEAWQRYNLSLDEVYSILVDIVQAHGQLSSRDVDEHVRSHYGKERAWTYYAERASRSLFALRQCPDVPAEIRKLTDELFSILGDKA